MTELDEVIEALIEPFKAFEARIVDIRLYSLCRSFVNQEMVGESYNIQQEVTRKLYQRIKQERSNHVNQD